MRFDDSRGAVTTCYFDLLPFCYFFVTFWGVGHTPYQTANPIDIWFKGVLDNATKTLVTFPVREKVTLDLLYI
jgi:hypothetical protein